MNIKLSKATLSVLVIILAIAFVASTIMYGKVNQELIAKSTQIIQQQGVEIMKVTGKLMEKQKELDKVKKELDNANKKLNVIAVKPEMLKK